MIKGWTCEFYIFLTRVYFNMVIPIKTGPDNYFVWLYQCLRPLSMFYHLFQLYKFLELHLRSFHH